MRRLVRFLGQLLGPATSLTHRVLRAGFWSVLLRSSLRLIGFARNVILARLLAPDDFGLFGIALVILSILERFSETGLRAALVQKKDDVQEYLDTAFAVQAVRGAFLALALWLSAPYVAVFFEEPRVTPFVQVLSLIVFLRGISNIGIVYLARELEVKRQAIHHIIPNILELVVSIVAAILLRNAWALMLGALVATSTGTVMTYLIHPYRPRLRFDLAMARELSQYGRWVFLSRILSFLSTRGDNLVIGKMLGAPALGIYVLAYSISEVITVEISRMVTNIAFPAYSRIQGELQRLQNAYTVALELVACFTLPSAIALWLVAESLTLVLLGEQWREVALVLPVLAIAGAIRTVVSNGTTAFKALGQPNRSFQVNLVGVIATYAAIFPLIHLYGLVGVAMAVLFGNVVTVPLYVVWTTRILNVDGWRLLRALRPAAVLSLAVALPLVAVGLALQGALAELLFSGLFGASAYLLVAWLLWRSGREGPFRLVQLATAVRAPRRRPVAPPVVSGSTP